MLRGWKLWTGEDAQSAVAGPAQGIKMCKVIRTEVYLQDRFLVPLDRIGLYSPWLVERAWAPRLSRSFHWRRVRVLCISIQRANADILDHLAQLFDRDSTTNETLWFSGPPLDVARTPAARYSLDYLYYLALEKKRKAGERVDDTLLPAQKRPRIVGPTVTDILQAVYGNAHYS